MEESGVMMRETPWQRIKRFFSNLVSKFKGEEVKYLPEAMEPVEEESNIEMVKPEDFTRFDSVTCAVKLLNREMAVDELTMPQVEEMIAFFEKEIETTTAEINRIQRV